MRARWRLAARIDEFVDDPAGVARDAATSLRHIQGRLLDPAIEVDHEELHAHARLIRRHLQVAPMAARGGE
jgi:hypothetical protein